MDVAFQIRQNAEERKESFKELQGWKEIEEVPQDKEQGLVMKEKGNMYFKKQKYKKAVEYYTKSLESWKNDVTFTNRALAHFKLRKFEAAIDDCSQALKLNSKNIKAVRRRAYSYKELGQKEKARSDLELALVLCPTDNEIKEELKLLGNRRKRINIIDIPVSNVDKKGELAPAAELTNNDTDVIGQNNESLEIKGEKLTPDINLSEMGEGFKKKLDLDNEKSPEKQRSLDSASSNQNDKAIELITKPTTLFEFEQIWRSGVNKHDFLKIFSEKEICSIFKNSLEKSILMEVVDIKDLKLIETFTKVPRFGMVAMFFGKEDKAKINSILSSFGDKGQELKKAFKIK